MMVHWRTNKRHLILQICDIFRVYYIFEVKRVLNKLPLSHTMTYTKQFDN